MNKVLIVSSSLAIMMLAACGGPSTPPAASDKPVATTPDKKPTPPATTETPAASVDKPAASAEPPKPKPANQRPAPSYGAVNTPQTVGMDGAVFRPDDGAELRIPNDWHREPRNVLFMVSKKGRSTTGKIGSVYEIHVQVPDVEYRMGVDSPSQSVRTQSSPFILKLPVPKGTQSANLAIETITLDPKTKANKSTWTIVAMTKLETADPSDRAVFELDMLPDGNIHLTSAAPSAAK